MSFFKETSNLKEETYTWNEGTQPAGSFYRTITKNNQGYFYVVLMALLIYF